MTSLRRATILLAIGFVLFGSTVSGKGPNVQYVKFVNETSVQVGVTADGTNANILSALSNSATAATNFTAAGGVLLNPSGTVSIRVQAGSQTVLAADMTQSTSTGGIEYITETVNVVGGFTTTVYIKSTVPGTFPTIQFSSTP